MDTKKRIRKSLDRLSFLSDVVVVGGAVRDALIGRESDDIDVATSDPPEEVKRRAERRGFKTLDTGIDHGTVTLVAGDLEYEVTTFRRDVSTDGRNATVEFADSVGEDLQRRDFTINAMAMEKVGAHLKLIDPYGGKEDIGRGLIRTVGNPDKRFREDLLRVVRAMRFASRYGFDISTDTAEAISRHVGDVSENVSVERVMAETKKAMKDSDPERFLSEVLPVFEDFLETDFKRFKTQVHRIEKPEDRMAIFIYELGTSVGTNKISFEDLQRKLKISTDLKNRASKVGTALFLLKDPVPDRTRRKVLAEYRDHIGQIRRIGKDLGLPERRFESEVPLSPIVTGQDLIDRGMEEGPKIGETIEKAHKIQLEQKITDTDTLVKKANHTF